MCTKDEETRLDLTESRYDLDTYWGRVCSHLQRRNPFRIFTLSSTLEEARCMYLKYRCGEPLPENLTEEDLWKAKALYESAYNAETGEKITYLAKPSVQVPINAALAGGAIAFYQSPIGIVVWQWLNQTYNIFVSYAYRESSDTYTKGQIFTSYVMATGTAVGTAFGLRHILRNSPSFARKFAPLAAIAAAHCVSVPLLRAQMLRNGAPIYDDCNYKIGHSKRAAQAGISGTIVGKILNAIPPFLVTPFYISFLENRGTLCRYPWIIFPASAGMAFLCLTFLSPLTCALYREKGLLSTKHIEPEMQEQVCKKLYGRPSRYVYYNRNL